MEDNKQIIEALHMQPLSESDKQSRHILGRLYGPIATCTEATRNGRKYNRELWENALNDDVFREKVRNKSLFLELGHPNNREETDMTKVCACIPEMPKIVGDDLYAYVDILDTDNGRLLKTLCDYGFVPGISSRGSGDIMDNDEVDPDTFFLETWDIVQLPAVKKARLQIAEGLDNNRLKLRKALTESINSADAKGKVIMKEALDNLDIKLDDKSSEKPEDVKEGCKVEECDGQEKIEEAKACEGEDCSKEDKSCKDGECEKDILEGLVESLKGTEIDQFFASAKKLGLNTSADLEKWAKDHGDLTDKDLFNTMNTEAAKLDSKEPVNEATEEIKTFPGGTPVDPALIPEAEDTDMDEAYDKETSTEKADKDSEEKETEDSKEKETKDSEEEEVEEPEKDEQEAEVIKLNDASMKDVKSFIDSLDKDVAVSIDPVTVDGVDYINELSFTKDEDGNLVVSSALTKVDSEEEPEEETEDPSAEDAGEESTVECLKEAIRQKAKLLKELKDLKSKEAVGNSEAVKLKEECEKYKFAFQRLSEVSGQVNKLKKQVSELTESLKTKEQKLAEMSKTNSEKLTESVNANKAQIAKLTEQLDEANENIASYKKLAEARTNIAKNYKAKCSAILTKYIESKADMLGVKASEITNRLSESYTLEDIDKVYDSLLNKSVTINRLPFGVKGMKVEQPLTESRREAYSYDPDNGYEPDDSLYELAGLK